MTERLFCVDKYRFVRLSYVQKQLFIRVLTAALKHCKYKLIIGFNRKPAERIFDLSFDKSERFRLKINLNISKRKSFGKGWDRVHEIIFRASYIAAYLKCVEKASEAVPTDYFDGLVLLNAIDDISQKRVEIYSALDGGNRAVIRPLEVSCAVNAINTLLTEIFVELPNECKAPMKRCVDDLLEYTALPEAACYGKGDSENALVGQLLRLVGTADKRPACFKPFAMFKDYGIQDIGDVAVEDLLKVGCYTENAFQRGVVMRLLLLSHNVPDERVESYGWLFSMMSEYCENCVYYFKSVQNTEMKILKDNKKAIKRVVEKINVLYNVESSGTVHVIE